MQTYVGSGTVPPPWRQTLSRSIVREFVGDPLKRVRVAVDCRSYRAHLLLAHRPSCLQYLVDENDAEKS